MIRHATLFTVDILHDYFLNRGSAVHEALSDEIKTTILERFNAGAFIDIRPTEETTARLRGHKLILKTTGTGFVVAVQTDTSAPDLRPAVPPAADFRLSFALTIRDPHFFNYTELGSARQALHRFSNASANKQFNQLFLSAPVTAYDTTRTYEAGAIYAASSDGVIDLFRAVRDTGPAATPVTADWERIPPDTWDASAGYLQNAIVLNGNRIYRALVDSPGANLDDGSKWALVSVLANQYASSADRLPLRPRTFNIDLTATAATRATLRIHPLGKQNPITERVYEAASGTLGRVQVDLRDLSAGAYHQYLLDDSQTPLPDFTLDFYLDDTAMAEAWFGVIDIVPGSGDFALLNDDGTLRSPRFILRFLNRSTRWRYIFPAAQPVGAGADVAAEGGNPKVLVTPAPCPLTRFGAGIRLQADDAGTQKVSEEVLLPRPEPRSIRRDNQQWYSEIQMSNLTL